MTNPVGNRMLDTQFLVMAYRHGYFPMADSVTGEISWYSPDPRAIIPLDEFKVSRSLRRTVAERSFAVTVDAAFDQVIRACADRQETWISPEVVRAYSRLHRDGYAHSIETWQKNALVGGLYGVAIGGAFFGESMFSKITDASKVALVVLVDRLRARGYRLLDSQIMNEHVRQFGAREISGSEYHRRLTEALQVTALFIDPDERVTG